MFDEINGILKELHKDAIKLQKGWSRLDSEDDKKVYLNYQEKVELISTKLFDCYPIELDYYLWDRDEAEPD